MSTPSNEGRIYSPNIINRLARDNISLENIPVYELSQAPIKLEEKLRSGSWVVLSAAAWSVYDMMSIDTIIRVSIRMQDHVQFAFRMFDRFEEHSTWCNGIDIDRDIGLKSSIWLFIKDGIVDRFYLGPLLGQEGEDQLCRRVMGWLNGGPKDVPPGDLQRLIAWVRSYWSPRSN